MGAQLWVVQKQEHENWGAGCRVGDSKDEGWGSVGCTFVIVNVNGGIFGVMCGQSMR